ncbi:hypothetical protein [Streptomyces sp. KMM 9044]|nr:hypothetical protein [Streptomyces sp. KMM 9044]WAX82156.1 hypothetical protein HUV60_001935 [Streptomyces sp. KMM 9044]
MLGKHFGIEVENLRLAAIAMLLVAAMAVVEEVNSFAVVRG